MTRRLRRLGLRAALGFTAAVALFAGPAAMLPGATAHADNQKTLVTFDCGSAGTVEIAGFPNDATAEPVVNSTQYQAFVGHEYWINGTLSFSDGSQGSIPNLHTCTAQQGGDTVVVLAQLL